MSFTYKYPRPAVTADIIIIKGNCPNQTILLIKRKNNPFKNFYALPGGFLDKNETLHDAAIRELKEETGIAISSLCFFNYYDAINRDPRHRTITAVFYYNITNIEINAKAGSDAKEVVWCNINNLPQNIAFDHKIIILDFIKKENQK